MSRSDVFFSSFGCLLQLVQIEPAARRGRDALGVSRRRDRDANIGVLWTSPPRVDRDGVHETDCDLAMCRRSRFHFPACRTQRCAAREHDRV